ncbi:MAG: FHA domain-containing protein [Butyrivibrio sp.]|nr:FHA domain-containing protein [Butyrivibrio sp.]
MHRGRRIRQFFDILIVLCGISLVYYILKEIRTWHITPVLLLVVVIGTGWILYDFFLLCDGKIQKAFSYEPEIVQTHGIQRLLLLDEDGKPIKSWDLQGRVSMIIGKTGQDQEPDIDLSDCEYSSFIDFQHAVLNFCLDQWYVEDLGSQNGIKVRKVEDGECYKVIHRPCRVMAGDIIYIANTKLLLT